MSTSQSIIIIAVLVPNAAPHRHLQPAPPLIANFRNAYQQPTSHSHILNLPFASSDICHPTTNICTLVNVVSPTSSTANIDESGALEPFCCPTDPGRYSAG